MTTKITARVDHENNAEDFWDEFNSRVESLDPDTELAHNCRQLLRADEVELLDATAIEQFDCFVSAIPGFCNGPDHARTAILYQAR